MKLHISICMWWLLLLSFSFSLFITYLAHHAPFLILRYQETRSITGRKYIGKMVHSLHVPYAISDIYMYIYIYVCNSTHTIYARCMCWFTLTLSWWLLKLLGNWSFITWFSQSPKPRTRDC